VCITLRTSITETVGAGGFRPGCTCADADVNSALAAALFLDSNRALLIVFVLANEFVPRVACVPPATVLYGKEKFTESATITGTGTPLSTSGANSHCWTASSAA
jgi:hypothetical protein